MLREFVYYDKRTGEVTGHFRTSTPDLLPKPLSPDEGHAEVTAKDQIDMLRARDAKNTRLRGRVDAGRVRTLKLEPIFRGRIALSTELKDRDGNGTPEFPADGEAIARITAELLDADGKRVAREPVAIRFYVDRGLLSQRQVTTSGGIAEVQLRSILETVRIRIKATAEGYQPGQLFIEAIPPDEHRALVKDETP